MTRRAVEPPAWTDGLGWLVTCAYGAFAFGIVGFLAGALAGRVLEPGGYEFAELVFGMLAAMVTALLGGAWLLASCPWPKRRRRAPRVQGAGREPALDESKVGRSLTPSCPSNRPRPRRT